MKMKYLLLCLCVMILPVGCQNKEPLSENGEIAKKHLEDLGYEVISHERDGWHEFSRYDLLQMPNYQIWAVQSITPDEYIDKRIDSVYFTIKNHPLDDQFKMERTTAVVFLFEGEVIGGWSFPIVAEGGLSGAPYSLDGKTAEEVQGDFHKWLEEWQEKYGSKK